MMSYKMPIKDLAQFKKRLILDHNSIIAQLKQEQSKGILYVHSSRCVELANGRTQVPIGEFIGAIESSLSKLKIATSEKDILRWAF